jgi:hypothetical protein
MIPNGLRAVVNLEGGAVLRWRTPTPGDASGTGAASLCDERTQNMNDRDAMSKELPVKKTTRGK